MKALILSVNLPIKTNLPRNTDWLNFMSSVKA